MASVSWAPIAPSLVASEQELELGILISAVLYSNYN